MNFYFYYLKLKLFMKANEDENNDENNDERSDVDIMERLHKKKMYVIE